MKTNWKSKLKTVLTETATAENLEICLETELTKGDKIPSDLVSSVFVSGEFTNLSENSAFAKSCSIVCPVCTAKIKREETEALLVIFCPLGCPFVECQFTENKEAVRSAIGFMRESVTADQLEALSDTLNERTAVFMFENGWNEETAIKEAENDILPALCDLFERSKRKSVAQ